MPNEKTVRFFHVGGCIYSIRNYNALKLVEDVELEAESLISIRNYNALKLMSVPDRDFYGLVSIRNYNALKPAGAG